MRRSGISINNAWNIIFEKHKILDHIASKGKYTISATTINEVKEARLMAKFDQSVQLPEIFQKNKLSILPITRGEYLIGPFQTYEKVIYPNVKPIPVEIPDLQTLDYTNLYSEASALLFAYNSGIIQDIMGSDKIAFTVNGRMSSGSFDYYINNSVNAENHIPISIRNTQVEIDAGYESPEAFCICEAKNIASEELLIRQLFYPYRLWKGKIDKPIIPVFIVFSNDIFHVFQYGFSESNYYNSIELKQHKAYTFTDDEITLTEIIQLWKSITPKTEPNITFPQADSFERVIDLLSVLYEKGLTPDEVTIKYAFDPRQTNYYISACEYLGLIERGTNVDREREYRLTKEAQIIMGMSYKPKHMALIKKVLECPVFHKVFGITIQSGKIPDRNNICKVMFDSNLRISHVTIDRRSSTARSWIDWILRVSQ